MAHAQLWLQSQCSMPLPELNLASSNTFGIEDNMSSFLRQSLLLAPPWGRIPPLAHLATISRPFKRNCRSYLQRDATHHQSAPGLALHLACGITYLCCWTCWACPTISMICCRVVRAQTFPRFCNSLRILRCASTLRCRPPRRRWAEGRTHHHPAPWMKLLCMSVSSEALANFQLHHLDDSRGSLLSWSLRTLCVKDQTIHDFSSF